MIGDIAFRLRGTLAIVGLLAVAALAGPLPAQAADDRPMTFTLGRLEGSKDCGVPCAQFIVAEGHIEQFSSFSYLIAQKRAGDRNLPVLLSSPGGYIMGADRLARVWRKLDVTAIVVGATEVCEPRARGKGARSGMCSKDPKPSAVLVFKLDSSSSRCASACTLAVAGATKRIAIEKARIGLHRSFVDPRADFAQLAERLGTTNEEVVEQVEKNFRQALEQLGIDPELALRAARTPATDMEWITPEDARSYRLFNARTDDAALQDDLRAALARR